MLKNSRALIASYVNSRGVRVFIPEKIKINGVLYTAPYTFASHRVSQSERTIFSAKSILEMNILFSTTKIKVYDAFTEHSLNAVIGYAVNSLGSKTTNTEHSRDGVIGDAVNSLGSKTTNLVVTVPRSVYEALL